MVACLPGCAQAQTICGKRTFWSARLGRPVDSPLNVERGSFLKEHRDALPGKGEKGLDGESHSCSHTGTLGGAPTGELGQRNHLEVCVDCVSAFSQGSRQRTPLGPREKGGGCSGRTTCQPSCEDVA